MKIKYFYPLFVIFIVVYLVRTFIPVFKYHRLGNLEFLPIILITIICAFFYPSIRSNKSGFKSILEFNAVALLGYLTVNVFLFFQWYWIITPKYRSTPGDMEEGFMWASLLFTIGSVLIIVVSSIVIVIIRYILQLKKINLREVKK